MPWCPKCRYEYLPEISNCPDCGIELFAQEPISPHIPKTTVLRIEPNFIHFVCVVSVSFIAQAIFMMFSAGCYHAIVEQTAAAMLVVSLAGFLTGLLPFVSPARILIGSLLGGVVWLTFILVLSMPSREIGLGMPSIGDFVGFAKSLFVATATLTAVGASTLQWKKNHSLKQAIEILLLIAIFTGAPYAIKYLYDTMLRHGVFIELL